MISAVSALLGPPVEDTEVTDYEREKFAELQSKLKLLENSREAQRCQIKEIRRQEAVVDQLMKQREWLQNQLEIRKGALQCSSEDDQLLDQLQELMHLSGDLDELLETEANAQLLAKNQISDFELKLLVLRKDLRQRPGQRGRSLMALRHLEDKLQMAVRRVNETVIRNKELREETQDMLETRRSFQSSIKALTKERQKIQEDIHEVSEQFLALCEESVQCLQQRAALRESETEGEEMHRVQQDLSFFWTKVEARESSHREAATQETVEDMITLEQVFGSICSETGETDLHKLLLGFIQAENQNSALSKIVNEQGSEIKALKDELEQIQTEMDEFEAKREQGKLSNAVKLEDLSKRLQEVKARTTEYENQTRDKSIILEEIQAGLNSISSKIGCDCDSDFSSSLGAIEQRTDEMLSIKAHQEAAEA